MQQLNGILTPYNHIKSVHPLEPAYIHFPGTIKQYCQLVVDLGYLAGFKRLDISYVTGKLDVQHNHSQPRYWRAIKYTLLYLVYTSNNGTIFKSNKNRTQIDPRRGTPSTIFRCQLRGDRTDLKSTTVVVVTYNNVPIYRASKNQSLMAMSTAESGYIAVAAGPHQLQEIK